MSFSLGIECCGVSTLEGLAYNFPSDGLVCSVMKARQNLVYTALFRFSDNKAHRILDDMLIEDGRLSEMLFGIRRTNCYDRRRSRGIL